MQTVNIPKIVSQNWDCTAECEIEFLENTSTLIIRPVNNKAQTDGKIL